MNVYLFCCYDRSYGFTVYTAVGETEEEALEKLPQHVAAGRKLEGWRRGYLKCVGYSSLTSYVSMEHEE